MKKLLALLLCVMLFISIVPTTAFAAVDLKPAYDALESLNNAYAQLATATAVKNAYNGAAAYANYYGKDSWAGFFAEAEKTWWKNNGQGFVTDVKNLGTGISYEDLFELIAPDVYDTYDNVGFGVELDVIVEVAKVQQSINDAIQSMLDSITA